MSKSMKIVRPLALVALTGILGAACFAQDFGPHLKGKPMVGFKMTDTKGKVHTNQSLKGKVVVLDFWATWCGPCKAASPTMQKLHEKFVKQGLVVIGANTFEQGAGAKTAAAGYAKEHGYTYTFTSQNDALAQKLGIKGIPAFLFIGRDGKVAEVQTGFGEELAPQVESIVKKLLAKK